MEMLPNWPERALADVTTVRGGGTPRRAVAEYFGGDIEWVTPTDLRPIGEVRQLGDVSETITEEGLANSSAKLLPPQTVLYSSRASIGKIAVTDRPVATNQGFANFTPKQGVLDPWFLAYYLCHATPQILGLCGETTYKEVSRGKLKQFTVPVPDHEEQVRVVGRINECLERIDEARQLREETALEADAVFPSSLAASFDDLGDAPRVTIGDIAAETRLGTSKKCRADADGVPVLRIPNVADREIHLDDLKYCPTLTEKERGKLHLQRGDILIVRSNGSPTLVGRSAVAEMENAAEYAFASYLIRLRLDLEVADPHYVNYFLTSSHGRRAIDAISRSSSGLHNVSSTNLKEIELPLPSLKRQQALVERMHQQRDAALRLVHVQREGSDELEALTGAVLRKAFAREL